uniref:Pleckstrin homology, MyTH4 and FERM domain containing H3 n=1 Tax=Paramormyrops kingsleyae TaxID=1676925 RepID=A0A3B3Q4R8_9TELE
MPFPGFCWLLCCRQGFSLLGRDYGEKEEEESFELRSKDELACSVRRSDVQEEMLSLIIEKCKMGLENDPEQVVKWLYREAPGSWIRQRRHWFVLTHDSLDCYSSSEKGARRLGTLVLTSLCSVAWPDKQTYKETENRFNLEVVEHIYKHNPILSYTQSPLYAPLLPFPYGSSDHVGKGYGTVREEAVRLFNCLQQLETAAEAVPLIQGVLQTCLDLRPLRDEVYCQLVKQTSGAACACVPRQLRYWQLLTCMSCTFLPGPAVLKYLRFHLKVRNQNPNTEMDNYASFIWEALQKTRCRECVPSWEEIQVLMARREILCLVHYPGPGSCRVPITSHTTADELVKMVSEKLGMQDSRNTFALFEQNAHQERAVSGSTIIADILTRFEKDPDPESQWRLSFKLYCLLDADSISVDSIEYIFLFEQCHEMMVRGQLPASEEDLQDLAALRLQCLMGDFSTHSPCPPLDEVFPGNVVEARVLLALKPPPGTPSTGPNLPMGCPQRFAGGFLAGALWSHTAAHKQRVEQDLRLHGRLKEEGAAVMGAIVERWKGLAGYSRRESIAAYLTIARQWSGFGCTLYEVDFYISSTGSFSQKLWLGVAAKCISLYRQGEAEALESFPYGQICSYGVFDSNTFKITAGDRDLLFETSKLTEIMQLMNAYLSAAQRY